MAEAPVRSDQVAIQGLTIRPARAEDLDRIVEIMYGDPMAEGVALAFGDAELARALGSALIRMPNSPMGWQRTVLAVLDGKAAGMLQAGAGEVTSSSLMTPGVLFKLLRIFGPVKFVRGLSRVRIRARVNSPHPPGAYVVHELHVDAAHRNRGIGGALLDYAEAEARRLGHTCMALSTTTSNPARHLYERHGFSVVKTRTDSSYERMTGIAGRHLMVKELA
jgi:ribosomal protein S18 acetylase RimI-like enzyme